MDSAQIHNVPEHFPPPGQTPARSQSLSAPAPVVETGPVPSLPPAREKAAGSSWPSCARPDPAPPPVQRRTTTSAFFLRLRTVGSWRLSSVLTRSSAWIAHWRSVTLPSRRISSTNNSSTASAVCNGPSALRTMAMRLWTRTIISGCPRSCSISWVSCWVNSLGSVFFCFIPTLFRDLVKFVHFIRENSSLPSPTFNHTPDSRAHLRITTVLGHWNGTPALAGRSILWRTVRRTGERARRPPVSAG